MTSTPALREPIVAGLVAIVSRWGDLSDICTDEPSCAPAAETPTATFQAGALIPSEEVTHAG